jgi:hypothetical protein
MMERAFMILLLCALGCGQQPAATTISIKVFPAVMAQDPLAEPATDWTRIEFAGGPRGRAGVYHLASKPIITDWNILTFKGASQPDGSMAVVARLNAYGENKMKAFSGDPANMKKPLAVNVDGRWADVYTLLERVTDRITIYGFTPEEIERLKKHLETR